MPRSGLTSSQTNADYVHFNYAVCVVNSERFVSPGTFFLCSFILLARIFNWLSVGYFFVVIIGFHFFR